MIRWVLKDFCGYKNRKDIQNEQMPGKISGRKAEKKVVEFTQASGVHRPSSDGGKILTQESTCNMLPVSSQNTCNPAYRDAKIRE